MKEIATGMLFLFWGFGNFFTGLFSYLLSDWKYFILYIFIIPGAILYFGLVYFLGTLTQQYFCLNN